MNFETADSMSLTAKGIDGMYTYFLLASKAATSVDERWNGLSTVVETTLTSTYDVSFSNRKLTIEILL